LIQLNKDGLPVEVTETLIDIKALEAKKVELELQIANVPKLKTIPDQEALDFYNGFMKRQINATSMKQRALDEINTTLKIINELK
jgi:cytoplasmic iron level regulating protein YaaA (DUF328/UPF0246 family)